MPRLAQPALGLYVGALVSGDVGEARHPQRPSQTWGGQLDGAEEWNVRDGSDVNPPAGIPVSAYHCKAFTQIP